LNCGNLSPTVSMMNLQEGWGSRGSGGCDGGDFAALHKN